MYKFRDELLFGVPEFLESAMVGLPIDHLKLGLIPAVMLVESLQERWLRRRFSKVGRIVTRDVDILDPHSYR